MIAKTTDEKEAMIRSISEIIRNAYFIDIHFTQEALETAPVENWRCFVAGDITVSINEAKSKVKP